MSFGVGVSAWIDIITARVTIFARLLTNSTFRSDSSIVLHLLRFAYTIPI
jgi:hypothetical protein